MGSKTKPTTAAVSAEGSEEGSPTLDAGAKEIPLRMKIIAVVLVSMIGFGSHWSGGVTGAMKSTIKKVCCEFI